MWDLSSPTRDPEGSLLQWKLGVFTAGMPGKSSLPYFITVHVIITSCSMKQVILFVLHGCKLKPREGQQLCPRSHTYKAVGSLFNAPPYLQFL